MLLVYILVRFVCESELNPSDLRLLEYGSFAFMSRLFFCRHHSLAIGVFASSTVGEFCLDAPADDKTTCLASQWVVAILYIGGGAGGTVTRRLMPHDFAC